MSEFWLNNYQVLFSDKNYQQFVPTADMDMNQKLNAVARFSIYLLIALFVLDKKDKWFYFPILLLLGTVMMYHNNKDTVGDSQKIGKDTTIKQDTYKEDAKEILAKGTDIKEGFQSTCPYPDFVAGIGKSPLGLEKAEVYDDHSTDAINYYYQTVDFNKDNDRNLAGPVCRTPTDNNPFMNPLANEYSADENIPKACNVEDDQINNDMKVSYNYNLFRNMNDVFEKMNSQRQFYSVPSKGVPNDQRGFADWCFGNTPTCKEDQDRCLRYEDLRFKSQFDPTHRIQE